MGGVCSDLPSSLHWRFVTADVGQYGDPQRKIVAAGVEREKNDIVWRTENGRTQGILMTSVVTFVHLEDGALDEYVPPAPPIMFKVPYDVFYPFEIYSGAPSQRLG